MSHCYPVWASGPILGSVLRDSKAVFPRAARLAPGAGIDHTMGLSKGSLFSCDEQAIPALKSCQKVSFQRRKTLNFSARLPAAVEPLSALFNSGVSILRKGLVNSSMAKVDGRVERFFWR